MTAKMAKSISQLSLGQTVTAFAGKEEKRGTIRFLGTTSFSEGEWVGLELEDDGGKNDGEIRGQRYFTCPPQRGLFVRPTMVKLPEPSWTVLVKTLSLRLQLAKAVEDNNVGAIQELLSQAEAGGIPEEEIDLAKNRLADPQAAPTEEGQAGELSLRLQLAEAIEENDVGAIEELLSQAEAAGVPQEEIDLAQRRLAYLQVTSEIVVEEIVVEDSDEIKLPLFDELGGEAEVKKHRTTSLLLQQKVAQMVKEGEDPASQPAIYQGFGLEQMLKSSVRFKNIFDDVCKKFAKGFQDKGYDVDFMAASIKSLSSAASKVNIEYHGDCRQLKDVVRGTLVIKSGKDGTAPSVADGYEILLMLVEDEGRFLEVANARFTRFSDRYQKPVGAAKYRDWLLLVKIGDFVCELQVNFEKAIQVKQDEQHYVYEMQRLATRKVLEAAMSNDYGMFHLVLYSSSGLDNQSLVNARDCNGFTALHYAARHGNAFYVDWLLREGANVLSLDKDGNPALSHAVAMGCSDACKILVSAIEQLPSQRLQKEPLASKLQCIWGAMFQSSNDDIYNLSEKLADVCKRAYSTPGRRLHAIARSGDVPAMKAAYKTLPLDYLKQGWAESQHNAVEYAEAQMLDQAILSGSAAMARMVAVPEEHGAPRGIQFQGFLEMFQEPQHVARLVRQGKVGRFQALHAVRPPDMRRMAELLVLSAEHEQLELALEIWTHGGSELGDGLTEEQAEKLVGLGMQAAGLGIPQFVQLLIDARTPLDRIIDGRSMIQQAARSGQTQIVELLADIGADIQNQVLDKAVCEGHQDTATALLERCANPNQSWDDGKQACSVVGQAILTNRPEMLKLLEAYMGRSGAEMYTEENLEFAESMQAFECLEFMRKAASR